MDDSWPHGCLRPSRTLTTGSNHLLHQLGCCVCLFLLTQLCVFFLPCMFEGFLCVACWVPERQVGLQEDCPESNTRWETVLERGNFELSTADAGASAGLSSELPTTEMSLWRHFEYIGDLDPPRFGPGGHVLVSLPGLFIGCRLLQS